MHSEHERYKTPGSVHVLLINVAERRAESLFLNRCAIQIGECILGIRWQAERAEASQQAKRTLGGNP